MMDSETTPLEACMSVAEKSDAELSAVEVRAGRTVASLAPAASSSFLRKCVQVIP